MKKPSFAFIRRHPIYVFASLLVLLTAAWFLWVCLPFGRSGMKQAVCMVEGEARLYLHSDTSYILLDSTHVEQQGVWINHRWAFPSCLGRVLTVPPEFPLMDGRSWPENRSEVLQLAKHHLDSLNKVIHRRLIEEKEMAYYLRTHGVQDEGYGRIALFASSEKLKLDSLQRLSGALQQAVSSKRLSLEVQARCKVLWQSDSGQWQQTSLLPYIGSRFPSSPTFVLRTTNHLTPIGIRPVSRFPWTTGRGKKTLMVSLMQADTAGKYRPVIVENSSMSSRYVFPELFRREGNAVFTSRGYFVGVINKSGVSK